MPSLPFFEGSNPIDRIRRTFLSNSISTIEVDPYRQGVELTQPKHFQQGMVKIWSGFSGHAIGDIDIGQRDDDIFPDKTSFVEVSEFSPRLHLSNYYRNEVIVLDAPISTNEVGLDGIIEPLSIRRIASFTSIDVPFEAKSVKGSLASGNHNPFRHSDQLVSLLGYNDLNIKTVHFEDNVDMMGRTPTNLGFWPSHPGKIVPFNDAQFRDGVQISPWTTDDIVVRSNAMRPASDRYGMPREGVIDRFPPTALISTAGLMTDYEKDWIHPIGGGYGARGLNIPGRGSVSIPVSSFDPATLFLTMWQRDFTIDGSGDWPGSLSIGPSGTTDSYEFSTISGSPIAGSSVNGHVPALLDGVDDSFTPSVGMSTHISASSFSAWILVNIPPGAITTNDSTNFFNNQALFGDSGGYFGNYVRSAGPVSIASVYDGASKTAASTLATNTWQLHQMRKNGAGQPLQHRINGGNWTSTAGVGDIAVVAGQLFIGRGFTASSFLNFLMLEFAISSTHFDDATFDNILGYNRARYQLVLL